MKKIIALAVALILVAGMSVTAFAAEGKAAGMVKNRCAFTNVIDKVEIQACIAEAAAVKAQAEVQTEAQAEAQAAVAVDTTAATGFICPNNNLACNQNGVCIKDGSCNNRESGEDGTRNNGCSNAGNGNGYGAGHGGGHGRGNR